MFDAKENDCCSSDEEEETPRTGRSTASKHHKRKTKNGQFAIDMTPPDKLLKRAEKKAKRYVKDKKVSKNGFT